MVNGSTLHYEERGSGPPLLLVHGTGTYADIWSPVLDGLARSHRVIAYDRRGFAHSSSALGGGLAEHARDAAALLNALDASPATVVGWSGGGVIALDLAASFPDCVEALVLAEPAVHLATHPRRGALAMQARFGFHRYARRRGDSQGSWAGFGRDWGDPPTHHHTPDTVPLILEAAVSLLLDCPLARDEMVHRLKQSRPGAES